jgi:hypothetical protein
MVYVSSVVLQGYFQLFSYIKLVYDELNKTNVGNFDQETLVQVVFSSPLTARYVRILPQSCQGHISMRAGLLFDGSECLRKELELCLQVMTVWDLKVILSEPDCAKLVQKLWYGSPWKDFEERFKLLSDISLISFESCLGFEHGASDKFKKILKFVVGASFLAPYAALTFDWPPSWRFWSNRLVYLSFCIIMLYLERQNEAWKEAGAKMSNPLLEVAAAVLLGGFLWLEVGQFFRQVINNGFNHQMKSSRAVLLHRHSSKVSASHRVTLLTALAAAISRGCLFAGAGNLETWRAADLYMWAVLLVWWRLVSILHVFAFLGPLLHMVEIMLIKDFRQVSSFCKLLLC